MLKNPDLVGQIQQVYYKMEHVESPISYVFYIVPIFGIGIGILFI